MINNKIIEHENLVGLFENVLTERLNKGLNKGFNKVEEKETWRRKHEIRITRTLKGMK